MDSYQRGVEQPGQMVGPERMQRIVGRFRATSPAFEQETIAAVKGLHRKGGQHATAFRGEKDIDPVCGTEVNESKADHQVAHMGNKYYFCAPECKTAFEENPEKYIRLLRFASNEW